MTLLLDSHIALAIAQRTIGSRYPRISEQLENAGLLQRVSVASIWEIAIKVRLGKLDIGMSIEGFLDYLRSYGLGILTVEARHAIAAVSPSPPTVTRSIECSSRSARSRTFGS